MRKVAWPLFYARMYIYFTTGGRSQPGAPFVFIAACAGAAELLMRSIPKHELAAA